VDFIKVKYVSAVGTEEKLGLTIILVSPLAILNPTLIIL